MMQKKNNDGPCARNGCRVEVFHMFQVIFWFLFVRLALSLYTAVLFIWISSCPEGLRKRSCEYPPEGSKAVAQDCALLAMDLYLPALPGPCPWYHMSPYFPLISLLLAICRTMSWLFWVLAFLLGWASTSFALAVPVTLCGICFWEILTCGQEMVQTWTSARQLWVLIKALALAVHFFLCVFLLFVSSGTLMPSLTACSLIGTTSPCLSSFIVLSFSLI